MLAQLLRTRSQNRSFIIRSFAARPESERRISSSVGRAASVSKIKENSLGKDIYCINCVDRAIKTTHQCFKAKIGIFFQFQTETRRDLFRIAMYMTCLRILRAIF